MDKIIESECRCGEKIMIEFGSNNTARVDKKRVFYKEDKRENVCVFRCRNCSECVHESVPGAEFISVT